MKYSKKKILSNLFVIAFLLVIPILSLAQDVNGDVSGNSNTQIINPLSKTTTISGFIKNILTEAIKIGLPIITLAIIYCGFLFVSAQGNSEKLGKAKDALLYTLIGAGILIGSWAIAQLISETVRAL